MKKEQSVPRNQIQEVWRLFPVYARELCEHYLDTYPEDGFIWAAYGDTLRRLARWEDAARALDTANGLAVDDWVKARVYGYRGQLAQKLGDFAAAEEWFRLAAGLEPHCGDWLLYLGISMRYQSRDDEAEACYRKALTLEAVRDEVLLNLGYVLQSRGDLEGAAQCYREALAIDPEYELAKESLEDVSKALEFRQILRKS